MDKELEEAREEAIQRRIESHSRGTEDRGSVYSFEEIAEEVEKYLPNTKKALKVMLAITTSSLHDNRVMLWMLLVGSPSSGKTDLVKLIRKNKDIFYLDSLTLNAFISGEQATEKSKVYDLLPLLDKKCFIIKDWTVIFSLDERMTKKIIGDMVGAYDKTLSKFSAKRGMVNYNSQFSQIGCITPATLNKHTQYLNMIGPRFLSYSIPELSEEEEDKSFKAIFSDNGDTRKKIESNLSIVVTRYLEQLNTLNPDIVKPLSDEVKKYLKVASKFMARARGIVIMQAASFKNDKEETIQYYELLDVQIEQPWRAVQQLMLIAKYLAFVSEKDEVGEEELEILKDIVMSSMPSNRAQSLKVIKNAENSTITAKDLSGTDKFNKSSKTARRLLDELAFLGILDKEISIGSIPAEYSIKKQYKDFICLPYREFMSPHSSGTEKTGSVQEKDVDLEKAAKIISGEVE